MKILRLYIRVLALLGSEARLGWVLAVTNVALAAAQFVEPLLFGRIVDAPKDLVALGGFCAPRRICVESLLPRVVIVGLKVQQHVCHRGPPVACSYLKYRP